VTVKVAINGFGRIGRCVLSHIVESCRKDIQVVAINAPGPLESAMHLLKYDSIHGKFASKISIHEDSIDVGTGPIRMFSSYNPEELDWSGVDVVLECTGK
jgi:glyceraldehyde 3-phosphate dehydrogenase